MNNEGSGFTVIGLGNPLMSDDGLGLALLERLRHANLGTGVTLVDGGTWGMNLLPVIEESAGLILLDAIRAGAGPGALVTLERHQLPRLLAHKLSPHQIDLQEVLALAELRGRLPLRTVAIGIEPARIELGTSLSPVVLAGLDGAAALVRDRLSQWGATRQAAGSAVCMS